MARRWQDEKPPNLTPNEDACLSETCICGCQRCKWAYTDEEHCFVHGKHTGCHLKCPNSLAKRIAAAAWKRISGKR